MAVLHQIRVGWSGLKGLPGVSTFYSATDKDVTLSRLRTFFEALSGLLPTGLVITYPTAGSDIETGSGDVVGTWTSASRANTLGSNVSKYAAPAGAVVNWHTGFYAGGRELRGKTFIVPLASDQYQTDGSLLDTSRSGIQAAAAAVVASGDPIVVYGPTTGSFAPGVSATVPDKVCILRSRRA